MKLACVGTLFLSIALLGVAFSAEETDQEKLKSGILSKTLHPGEPVLPSTILGEEMVKVINQAFTEIPAEKKKFAPGTTEEQAKAAVINQIRTSPCVMVTSAEEDNFKAGKFDDVRNTKMMKQFKDIITGLKVDLPMTEQIFFREFDAGKLSGARLEAGVRSAFMFAGRVRKQLEKEKNEPKK